MSPKSMPKTAAEEPRTDTRPTRWIAACARHVYDTRRPTLTLVYLPHLDYNLQRLGPHHPDLRKDLGAVDAICGELIQHVRGEGTRVVVLSEYGITDVRGPVHPNRALREAGLIRVRLELGRELLDTGASDADADISMDAIKDMGQQHADLKLCILTHRHGDHTGGLKKLKKTLKFEVMAHELDMPAIHQATG